MSDNLRFKSIRFLYLLTSTLGAFLFFGLLIRLGDNVRKDISPFCQETNLIEKISCLSSRGVDKIYREFKNLGNLKPGSRLLSKSSDRFKDLVPGFSFYYPENSNRVKGYLLLSKFDADKFEPKLELWDLNSQSLLHYWEIDIKELKTKFNLTNKNLDVLRFIHPLMLEDGSIVTHLNSLRNDNTPLLKFNKCGDLINSISNNYDFHHSIELDEKGKIYVPITNTKNKSDFYNDYKEFQKQYGDYRDEGIAKLDKNLNLEEIIALDKIFYSAGLLNDLNSSNLERFFAYDPYHLNDVHPFLNDQGEKILFLSMRHYGLMAYNETQSKVDWVIKGLTDFQHDITPLENEENTITIFDNGSERNTPLGKFKGNTLLKLKFLEENTKKTNYYLGRNIANQGVLKERIDFSQFKNFPFPNTILEGRGRILKNKNIFIEETGNGRLFEVDLKKKKVLWTYLNKSKTGNLYHLGWSRYYEELPANKKILNSNNCYN